MKFPDDVFVNQIEVDYSFFLSADHFYHGNDESEKGLNTENSLINFGSRESQEVL